MAAPILVPNVMPPPPQIITLPIGSWGISYDISTRKTESDLPHGWHARRTNTYKQLIRRLRLAGFERRQLSDYHAANVSAAHTWNTMWSLRNINPPMKLQSTVLGLKMQHYHDPDLFDITADMQLGGAGPPQLLGPTPAGLLPPPPGPPVAGALGPFPVVPAANFALPGHTVPSANAANAINWRT